MKYTVLMGSPRKNGNTAALLRAFMEENRDMGIEQDMIWLYDRTILPLPVLQAVPEHALGDLRLSPGGRHAGHL